MLSVEIASDDKAGTGEIVEVYFDREGLAEILARLNLIQNGKADHIHLMSESWGLGDLDEKKHKETNLIVHHLQFSLIEKE